MCMSFSVHHDQLIMTAQASTKKVLNLYSNSCCHVIASNRQPNIDVGINADASEAQDAAPWRITLHCRCTIIADSDVRFAPLREIHLAHNPGYKDFILPRNNVVLLFDVIACAVGG